MTDPFDDEPDFDVDDDDLPRRRPWALRITAIGIVVALLAGFSGGIVRACDSRDDADADEPLALESTGPEIETLEELVTSSATVVIARAVSVAPGRVFGSESTGLRSQIVTLEVGRVLAGADPGPTLALEEEATLASGRPVVVDGLRPTRAGDQGIFFLVPSTDPDVPYFATVATAGRYLRTSADEGDDGLIGAEVPLAEQLAALGGSVLTDRVLAVEQA